MFQDDAVDEAIAAAGIAPLPSSLKEGWEASVASAMAEARLTMPDGKFQHTGGKRGVHSEHLGFILAELQFLQRAYPGCTW